MKQRIILAIVALLPSFAVAQVAVVAGQRLNLAVPPGYCATEQRSGEPAILGRVREHFEGLMQVLSIYLPCDDLKRLLNGKSSHPNSLPDFGVISVPRTSGEIVRMEGVTRRQFIDSRREDLTRQDADGRRARDKGLRQADGDLKAAGSLGLHDLGVIDIDENAIYTATVDIRPVSHGTATVRIVSITSLTLIHGFQVWVTQYRLQRNQSELPAVLLQQKSLLSSIVVANQ